MAGIAKPMGTIVLRQTYNKPGHNYMVMTVPAAMYEAMGWKPGDEMAFYPVRYENGLEAMLLVLQHGVIEIAVPNLDTEKMQRRTQPFRAPRPGSIAEREAACDDVVQGLLDRHDRVDAEEKAARQEARLRAEKAESKKAKRRRRTVALSQRRPAG